VDITGSSPCPVMSSRVSDIGPADFVSRVFNWCLLLFLPTMRFAVYLGKVDRVQFLLHIR